MKVILLQEVKNLGKKDDIIEVAESYARNVLLAKKLAIPATNANVNVVAQSKSAQVHHEQRQHDEARLLASQLAKTGLRIAVVAGEGGKIFGTITSKDIAAALKEQHDLDIDKKKIDIQDPIKLIGSYKVRIKLHSTALAEVALEVVEK